MDIPIIVVLICIIVIVYHIYSDNNMKSTNMGLKNKRGKTLSCQMYSSSDIFDDNSDDNSDDNRDNNNFSFYDGPSSYEFFDQDGSNSNKIEENKVNKKESELKQTDLPDLKKSRVPRVAPAEYSENNYKNNIFDGIGSLGDNIIAQHMKHISNKNRVAIDNFARQNKNTNINYLNNELDEHANSLWWDDDDLEREFN